MDRVLVTGAAGFIGFHVARRFLEGGHPVVGADNFNPYYSVRLKNDRAGELSRDGCEVQRVELADHAAVENLFKRAKPQIVVHLAAQPGVRYSIENPRAYGEANLTGFLNVLEACRHHNVGHLVYASSSSVYGSNAKSPFSVSDPVDHPVSLYAATKKANELMAHTYSHLFALPATGLRFFTVYGPWGRPDMATWLFTEAILTGKPINVYNFGKMKRDFTYVDDVAEGVFRVARTVPLPNPAWDASHPDPGTSTAPYRVHNIGNHQPTDLLDFVATLERVLDRKASLNLLPLQPGDVLETCADTTSLQQEVGFAPSTPLEEGLRRFALWFRDYNQS